MNRELLTRGTLEEQYYPRKKGNYKKIWNKTFYVLKQLGHFVNILLWC